jgi:hypothetical protein
MLAYAVTFIVLTISLYIWVYASTKDVDLTLSLVNDDVRGNKRLTGNQILLLDITNNMRCLIVFGLLFSGLVDMYLFNIKS